MAIAAAEDEKNGPSQEPISNEEHKPDSPDYESSGPDDEKYQPYLKSIVESGGYDVAHIPSSGSWLYIVPVLEAYIQEHHEFFQGLAELVIDEINKKKKTNYELEKLVKVNFHPCAGEVYYLTFTVKNKNDAEQNTFRCRGQVYQGVDDSLTVLCFEDGNPQAGESGEEQVCTESCQEEVGCLGEDEEEAGGDVQCVVKDESGEGQECAESCQEEVGYLGEDEEEAGGDVQCVAKDEVCWRSKEKK